MHVYSLFDLVFQPNASTVFLNLQNIERVFCSSIWKLPKKTTIFKTKAGSEKKRVSEERLLLQILSGFLRKGCPASFGLVLDYLFANSDYISESDAIHVLANSLREC